MSEIMEIIKRSDEIRKVTIVDNPPNFSFDIYRYEHFSYQDVKRKIYYNGGANLVNYGLNCFVRDIYYFNSGYRKLILYFDRFGKSFEIYDDNIINIIANAKLCISPEGVLIFYTEDLIYITLNCNVGRIIEISSLLNESDVTSKSLKISNIFVSNKRTYLESNIDSKKYELSFSFDFTKSYGTIINVHAIKIDFCEEFEFEYSSEKVFKQSGSKYLKNTKDYCNFKIFKSKFKNYICGESENIKNTERDKKISCRVMYSQGDAGIDKCINAFVNEIKYTRVSVVNKKGLFRTSDYIKNVFILKDRFDKLQINTNMLHSTYDEIEKAKFFVSAEGVIIGVSNESILISLDGIIWKSTKIDSILENSNEFCYFDKDFQVENLNNYLIFTKNYKEHIFIVKFYFNFFDLYDSPVEIEVKEVKDR